MRRRRAYDRYLAACKERHGRYLQLVELLRSPGGGFGDAFERIVTEGPNPCGRRMPLISFSRTSVPRRNTDERRPMDGIPQTTLPEEAEAAIVRASERLEGTASLLAMLEDKADNRQVTAAELAAVRCIVEACAADLGGAWEKA